MSEITGNEPMLHQDTAHIKKVWLVTRGSYSDYQVVNAWSSEEDAHLCANAMNKDSSWNEAGVEEYSLDDNVRHVREGKSPYHVQMTIKGKAHAYQEWRKYEQDGLHLSAPYRDRGDRAQVLSGIVWALNKQSAIQIANDRRAQLIASGEWTQ